MLRFNNEPTVLTQIHLSYLTLEDKIGFVRLTDEVLVKQGPAKLELKDIPKFRQTIQLSLESDYQQLIAKVRIFRQPGDDTVLVLARTISEQQREIASLLKNLEVSDARKAELRALNPEDSIQNVIALDGLLNTINMELAESRLPEVREGVSEIDLTTLGLTRFPEALVFRLQEYPQLVRLYLTHNNLTCLPETIGRLTALKFLILSHNQLTSLPQTLGNLTALQVLNLENNQFTSLPETLGSLTALKSLYLDNNQLTSLPEIIGRLTSLKILNLYRNQLTSLPESIGSLTALESLYLDNNQLTSLPEIIGRLTSLKILSLYRNQLTSLPESIGNLTALEFLYLDNNQLTSLPEIIGSLTALQVLNLENNQFTSLPETLGRLTALENFDLSNNQFTSLPESLRAILTQTDNTDLLPLLAQPVTTELLIDKLKAFITENQGKSVFEKISALNLTQLNQLNASIIRKKLGVALDDNDKNQLTIFSIDEALCKDFIAQCIKAHGNLFLGNHIPSIPFQGERFKSYHALAQHVLDNVLDVFYPQIQETINTRLRLLKPAPVEHKGIERRQAMKPAPSVKKKGLIEWMLTGAVTLIVFGAAFALFGFNLLPASVLAGMGGIIGYQGIKRWDARKVVNNNLSSFKVEHKDRKNSGNHDEKKHTKPFTPAYQAAGNLRLPVEKASQICEGKMNRNRA